MSTFWVNEEDEGICQGGSKTLDIETSLKHPDLGVLKPIMSEDFKADDVEQPKPVTPGLVPASSSSGSSDEIAAIIGSIKEGSSASNLDIDV